VRASFSESLTGTQEAVLQWHARASMHRTLPYKSPCVLSLAHPSGSERLKMVRALSYTRASTHAYVFLLVRTLFIFLDAPSSLCHDYRNTPRGSGGCQALPITYLKRSRPREVRLTLTAPKIVSPAGLVTEDNNACDVAFGLRRKHLHAVLRQLSIFSLCRSQCWAACNVIAPICKGNSCR